MTGIFTPAYPVSKRTGSDGLATIPPDGIELAHAYRADSDSQLKVTGTSAVPGRQQRVLASAFAESPILGNQLEQNTHALCANRFGLVGLGRRPAEAAMGCQAVLMISTLGWS